jgi:hypothetical protein
MDIKQTDLKQQEQSPEPSQSLSAGLTTEDKFKADIGYLYGKTKEQEESIKNAKESIKEQKNYLMLGFIALLFVLVGIAVAAGAWWTNYEAEKRATYQDWIDTIHNLQYQTQSTQSQPKPLNIQPATLPVK